MFSKVIPEYATNYKKEYLFIRGINKEIKYFIDKLDNLNDGLFESHKVARIKYLIKRFLRGQEKGRLKDISEFEINENDVYNLIKVKYHFDLFKLRYDAFDDDDDDDDDEYLVNGKPYPGFENIYDDFVSFFNKLKIKYEDSDSDSDSEFENVNFILPDSDDDSDSDSDSF